MSAASGVLSQTVSERSMGHTVSIYAKEAKYEFLKLLRLPIYSL